MSNEAFTSPFLQQAQCEIVKKEDSGSRPADGVQEPTALQVESYPFSRLCAVFECLEHSVNKQQQTTHLTHFWQSLRRDESFFPYMRLLLPQLDNERTNYQLRESKLARLYVDILGLSHDSADAQRLLRWKDPSKSTIETTAFSDAICALLTQRGGYQQQDEGEESPPPVARPTGPKYEMDVDTRDRKTALSIAVPSGDGRQPSGMSVAAINRSLDHLASAADEGERRQVMLHLVRHTSVLEQKWLIRIILRDTRIRMTHQSMLAVFHPSALDVLNSTNDLRRVCDVCVEDTTCPVPGSVAAGIFLFQPLRPMLASPISAKKLEQLLEGHPAIVAQPKYDGERIMIHLDRQRVMYWTRNAKNYTPLYGPKFDSVVRAAFPIGARCRSATGSREAVLDMILENVILDGEFLVYDGVANTFEAFGGNRTLALTAEDSGGRVFRNGVALAPPPADAVDGTSKWFCYMVFDVVMLNGTSLINMPFTERQALLRVILKETPKRVELVPSPVVHSTAEILSCLESSLKDGNEGIVLKRAASLYIPGERKGDWIKMKPDHIAGLADSLDLVVVGGYYGTKFGTRNISHFLLATWANGSSASPRDAAARFHTFCKVGNGYTSDELQLIQTTLEPFWERTTDRQTVPDWLGGWKPVGSDLIPDLYIHPKHSLVLEVFGYAFTDTANYRAGYTIRFPRMLSIRWDKNLEDATDAKTLAAIREASVGALHRRLRQGNDELLTVMSLKWKRRREQPRGESVTSGGTRGARSAAGVLSLPPSALVIPTEKLGVTSLRGKDAVVDHLFDGYEFCVLFTSMANCDPRHAHITGDRGALEKCMLEHGARVVANPGRRTSLLLASSATVPKVANWVHLCRTKPTAVRGHYAAVDVAHCDWIMTCVEAGQVVPLVPRLMVFAGPTLQKKFATLLDKYEDSYTEPCTVESLSISMQLALQQVTRVNKTVHDCCLPNSQAETGSLLAALSEVERLRAELCLPDNGTIAVAAVRLAVAPPKMPTKAALAGDPNSVENWAAAWLSTSTGWSSRSLGAAMSCSADTKCKMAKTERGRATVKLEDTMTEGSDELHPGANGRDCYLDALVRQSASLRLPYTVTPDPRAWSTAQLRVMARLLRSPRVRLIKESKPGALLVDTAGVTWLSSRS